MKLTALEEQLAGWLRRIMPRGHEEEQLLARTIIIIETGQLSEVLRYRREVTDL
jgi:hypothetical protein